MLCRANLDQQIEATGWPGRSSDSEPVALVEIAAVVLGKVAQALQIMKLDATFPEGHEAALAQLPQDAVHVDRGEARQPGDTG